jgi:cellulose synthase/poly-beta-1,6-N-acetylglucosamine synthase-like glycosyltransferase
VPAPRFLKRAMALFRDATIGVVQTPQHFINPDPIQINLGAARFWPDEQRYFFDVVMPAKDAWSAAFCCGTSSVIRMAPLMTIGGFPTDSVTGDCLLTLRLKETGYTTAYLNEPLSFGLAPEGLKEYVEAKIVRITADAFAVAFIHTFETRIAMIRHFYAGGYLKPLDRIRVFRVGAAVARRVLD